MAFKHVGRIKTNKRKVIVAYKTVPNEPEQCLVVTTENLDAADHDSLMKLVESDAGQNEFEFAEAMARARLSDGRIMLSAFHTQGKLQKVDTNMVEMTPDRNATIMLDELNKMIADQKGVGIEDLATINMPAKEEELASVSDVPTSTLPSDEAAPAPQEGVLSDEDLAKQYRSQADTMFKEAQRLRKEADELAPTKKKATAKTKESA
jgi:hypothetical protein